MRAPLALRAAAVVALLLLSFPASAGELPALEHGWKADSVRIAGAFLGDAGIRFESEGQVVELVRSRMEEEWISEDGGRMEVKRTWIGDLWIDGRIVRENGVVSTTFKGYTWTTVTSPRGSTVLFPDGRVEYTVATPVACGTDTSHTAADLLGDSALPEVIGKATPPKPIEITEGVSWTKEAEAYWGGGQWRARARLLNLQDVQNQVFRDSGFPWVTVRFVGFHKDPTWNEARQDRTQGEVLYAFAENKVYKNLRKQWKADTMAMFVTASPGPYMGIALLNGPYKLVRVQGPEFTYPHELGHNMGLPHTRAYVHCASHPEITTDDGFTTIMFSYLDPPVGLPIPLCGGFGFELLRRYSNKDPNVTYANPYTGGTFATGDALHDEAATITKKAPTVAAWKK